MIENNLLFEYIDIDSKMKFFVSKMTMQNFGGNNANYDGRISKSCYMQKNCILPIYFQLTAFITNWP